MTSSLSSKKGINQRGRGPIGEAGASLVEYALLVALLLCFVVVTIGVAGRKVKDKMDTANCVMDGAAIHGEELCSTVATTEDGD